jgi:hypothetical protein
MLTEYADALAMHERDAAHWKRSKSDTPTQVAVSVHGKRIAILERSGVPHRGILWTRRRSIVGDEQVLGNPTAWGWVKASVFASARL